MKKIKLSSQQLVMLITVIFCIISCKKPDKNNVSQEIIQDSIVQGLKTQGFSINNIQKVTGGYIVEGDIFLSNEQVLQKNINNPAIRIANTEQYRTFNLLTGLPRIITITAAKNLPAAYIASIDAAIARYNSINPALCLTFQRVENGGAITITDANLLPVSSPNYISNTNTQTYAISGFPSAGNPWNTIGVNVANVGISPNANFLTTLFAHEIGHCIGMRHTDVLDRNFSCGLYGGGTESEINSGIGAVNIPGTPVAANADPTSWMLSCMSATTNRAFNNNDILSLRFLYGCQSRFIYADPCGGIYSTATLIGNVGDQIVLRISYGGYLSWTGMSNGTGASISLSAGGQNCSSVTPHYKSSTGFNLSCDVTFTMSSQAVAINTSVVVYNSSTMTSSTATLTIVSVNGVAYGSQGVVCGGNSGGNW
jgi:hypothetical protein